MHKGIDVQNERQKYRFVKRTNLTGKISTSRDLSVQLEPAINVEIESLFPIRLSSTSKVS